MIEQLAEKVRAGGRVDAADALVLRDFTIERNLSGPLTKLDGVGVLVIVHPCDPHWERTTSCNSPAFSADEIESILLGLQQLPFGRVVGLWNKLQAQIEAQRPKPMAVQMFPNAPSEAADG